MVFTGTMDYDLNENGMLYFCERIMPLILAKMPSVRLYIVGQRPSKLVLALQQKFAGKVVVTGFVDDVRPYLQRAAVCVVPLLNGGGTRLKILEAMAMQKPVVSTAVGAEGLGFENGREIVIADLPDAFAQGTITLLQDFERRQRQISEAVARVRRQFDWTVIAEQLEHAWQEVLAVGRC
jgi:glycosyltransferase involved in cell wall biosynthesis